MAGQVQASLGLGVSAVRNASSSASAPAISPSAQYTAPSLFAGLSGTLASLSRDEWSTQGRAGMWLASPPLGGHLRLAAEGTVAGTARTGGPSTAAVHGLGEVFWAASRGGVGIGAGSSYGWIEREPSVTALHLRMRGWFRAGGADWVLSAEPTRFFGSWFTDASATLTVDRGPIVASLWGLARLSRTYGSKVTGSAFVQLFVAPVLALELGGGGYLPDPYQGLPRASYISGGVRLYTSRRIPRTGGRPVAAPLVPAWRGDSLTVRFRMKGATSVALAGDWNGWQPLPLRQAGGETWEGTLSIPPGAYHFVLMVDGREWVVPKGVATVPDGMGGLAALLLVQPPPQ
jgi:Glycogen recognition site of AMP-activated protein kinase